MVGVELTVGLAVGGWFASSVIGKLINAASGYAKDQMSLSEDMKCKLKKLNESRAQIETLVFAAERGTVELSPGLQSWLWQLRDAVEAADSVLDEIEYRRLRDEVTGEEKAASSAKRKVFSFARRAVKADPAIQSLQEVVTMFDGVLAGLGTFAQVVVGLHVASVAGERKPMLDNPRETSFLETELKLFGRVREVKEIIEWILTDDTAVVSALSVVGIGGLGKTALAQHVFNEKALEEKFKKIWVYVSSRFEPTSIAKKMLKSVTNVNYDVDTLDEAHRGLKEQLMGKKFLLVLDDVWNDADRVRWERAIAPLRCAGHGSNIILTTRLGSVVDMVGKIVEQRTTINLEGIQEDEYLSLFNKHAFAGVMDPDEYGRLPSIGKEISKKLKGIPLAAKAVGAMLNSHLDDEYWTQILATRTLDIEKNDNDLMAKGHSSLMATLRLSYQHLDMDLRRCFRYCSIFPQGYEFTKEDLVQLWIAAGLIPQPNSGCETLEDVAGRYFDNLVRKSFFDLKVSFYVIHDLLHELAQTVAIGECFRAESNEHAQIASTTRHLYLETSDILVLKKIPQLKYLHTLILHFDGDEPQLSDVINNMLRGFVNLRVLALSVKFLQVLPVSIGDLIHLRYLYICRTQIDRLPQCICQLYHLQFLLLERNSHFELSKESIPVRIHDLDKLKFLYIPFAAISMIPGIGKMTSLEVLNGYSIKNEQGHKISELENMSELRVLLIRDVQNVTHPEEAAMAKLDSKRHLRCLSLFWSSSYGFGTREGGGELAEQVLDRLKPHCNLKELAIDMYGGITVPSWLSNELLPNLTSVYLGNCNGLQTLPALGKLRFLKNLVLDSIKVVKQIGPEFYGPGGADAAFRKLEALNFQHMEGLEEWYADASSGQWFPRLNTLVISVCPKLRRLPPLPVHVKYLELGFLDEITSLPEIWRPNETSSVASSSLLSSLHVIRFSKISSLANGLLRHPGHLDALEDITIWNCANLVHLPVDEFTKFADLKKLAIQECKKLVFIPIVPGSLLPPSIEMLTLDSCGDLDMSLHLLLKGISSFSFVKLARCANLTALPSIGVLGGPSALNWLVIEDCPELASLGGLSALPLLKILEIKKCPKLDSTVAVGSLMAHGASSVLDRLDIDSPSLLQVEPLRSLITTKFIQIRRCSEISELPEQWLWRNRIFLQVLALYDAGSLHHLPENLSSFSSLQTLVLRNVRQLQTLPELPRSLKVLAIYGCTPEFEGKYKHGGSDWLRISHVPDVIIDLF